MKAKREGKYEFVFVLSPLEEKEGAQVLEGIRAEIKKEKGEIAKEEKWGEKTLAYPIKKQKIGNYYCWEISLPAGAKMDRLNLYLKREKPVLRYLLLKKAQATVAKKTKS